MDYKYLATDNQNDSLMHHGIPGMKWGVRKDPLRHKQARRAATANAQMRIGYEQAKRDQRIQLGMSRRDAKAHYKEAVKGIKSNLSKQISEINRTDRGDKITDYYRKLDSQNKKYSSEYSGKSGGHDVLTGFQWGAKALGVGGAAIVGASLAGVLATPVTPLMLSSGAIGAAVMGGGDLVHAILTAVMNEDMRSVGRNKFRKNANT